MGKAFERIAIVNRGEPAMRLIHAVREYNMENNARLTTLAFFTEPDNRAMYVREADEAFHIGDATYLDERDGQRKISYLDYRRLEKTLIESKSEAAWVGWGFVAEHPEFADLCKRLGIVFIGPDGDVMRKLGDKITSKLIAERAGVPVAPWSGGAIENFEEAKKHSRRIGYPIVIKATAGGGGRGIRKVQHKSELKTALNTARTEALKSFGDATVFIEKMMQSARHIEVQVLADHYGNTWAVGVRDCTLQRRNQKVMEESPSPVLTPAQDKEIREAAARLCESIGYHNAGTVEFLYDPETRKYYFMEVNARLQVEHPVTEMTTGLDLVKLQLHIAGGGKLDGKIPESRGHAIEVRLNAEDPTSGFSPAPGKIEEFRIATGPGLRIDTGVNDGDEIPSEFDSMIAKIIACGKDRSEALARLRRGLLNTSIVIDGGTSNKGFLMEVLNRPEIINSAIDIGWLDQLVLNRKHLSQSHSEIAVLQSAIEVYLAEMEIEKAQFFTSAHRGRPSVREESGVKVDLSYEGQGYTLNVYRLGLNDYRIDINGKGITLNAEKIGESEWILEMGNQNFKVYSVAQGFQHMVEVNGTPHRVMRDIGGLVRAPSPAVISSILVQSGDKVDVGDRLIVIEAMKMEMIVSAAFAGTVKEVFIRNNMQVDTGSPLLEIEPEEQKKGVRGSSKIDFGKIKVTSNKAEDILVRCTHNLDAVKCLMLGFDTDTREMKRIMEERTQLCMDVPDDNQELFEREEEILNIFGDIISLFRREPNDEELEEGGRLSTEEYLFTYLLNTRAGEEGLPTGFINKLLKALAHYDIENIEPGPQLDLSLFRICKSYQRMPRQIGLILSILERRLENLPKQVEVNDGEFRSLLDGIISQSEGRFPTVYDLAREVRYSYFEKPLLERVKKRIYQEVEENLKYLDENPESEDRVKRINSLVNCPQPLKAVLSNRFFNATPEMHKIILEVMSRRYYRIRDLKNVQHLDKNGLSVFTAEYNLANRRVNLFSTYAGFKNLKKALTQLIPLFLDVPQKHEVVLDLYVQHRKPMPADVDRLSIEFLSIFNKVQLPKVVRRIVATSTGIHKETKHGGVKLFTFRRFEGKFEEDKTYRGLHVMMGKRLEIWRLSNFEIEQIFSDSVEDVYLFKAIAKDNPKDQRLFAFAEVRDLTLVGRDKNHIIQVPALELMLFQALAVIRRYQAKLPLEDRPFWNRILLYIWPVFDINQEELNGLVKKLAPASEGLGLEKIVARAKIPNSENGELEEVIIEISNPADSGLITRFRTPGEAPIRPLTSYAKKVVQLRRRGLIYPYELIKMLAPNIDNTQSGFPPGEFAEYDLNERNELVSVDRKFGLNNANIVVGVIKNFTSKYPEGMTRVALFGDPSRGMGSLAEPECRRIMEGIHLAAELNVPLEWFAVSAGAKISMDSGTENMDWIARVLRLIVEHTQAGGEINVIVTGVNVGAQPYWNAEATMLMHTKGILIMTSDVAMVLTGKQALDYSGGVSAEDNQGIGGYERIMGPNGQAQYFARDISDACLTLLRYYDHAYVFPGERFPRRAHTDDPAKRDIRKFSHGGEFKNVGAVFSKSSNPGRKKPFDIRRVMLAAIDQDQLPMERWYGMKDAEMAVVWDAHIAGYPVCLIGLESRPLSRLGVVPADGPDSWTSGTLFPLSSKKVARAINSASNNRPVVVLANLSGFDGSPESLRKWQLEYGAEIGRAVVNFKGPIVFCVISRYHGGAFVVFSNALNDNMEVAAVEGAYASVIGGAPAAAVVFAREVEKRTQMDSRILTLESEIALAKGVKKVKLRSQWNDLYQSVYSEKLGIVADEFDAIHSIQRAMSVGSVDKIIPAAKLRPYIVDALERGMKQELERE